jgi:hypothetical protein
MNRGACLQPVNWFERRTNTPRRITPVPSDRTTYESVASSPWQNDLISEANKLFTLEPGWDSYGAEPIPVTTILIAVNTLVQVLTDSSPAPRLVPGSSGSVQAEWCLDNLDVEIEFDSSPEIRVWYEDDTGPHETYVNKDVGPLLSVIQRLSQVRRNTA